MRVLEGVVVGIVSFVVMTVGVSCQGESADVTAQEKACEANDWLACRELGTLYSNRGGRKNSEDDRQRGTAFYRRACEEGGDAFSCFALGIHYKSGAGVPRDLERAASFLEKGCDLGNAGACAALGDLYRKGNGVPQDLDRANALYRRVIDLRKRPEGTDGQQRHNDRGANVDEGDVATRVYGDDVFVGAGPAAAPSLPIESAREEPAAAEPAREASPRSTPDRAGAVANAPTAKPTPVMVEPTGAVARAPADSSPLQAPEQDTAPRPNNEAVTALSTLRPPLAAPAKTTRDERCNSVPDGAPPLTGEFGKAACKQIEAEFNRDPTNACALKNFRQSCPGPGADAALKRFHSQ